MYKTTTTFDVRQRLAKANNDPRRRKAKPSTASHQLSKPCIKGYRQCPYNNGDGACLYGADQCTKKEIK
jgi:hypothetical protein